jgi:hypothetical protein
MHHLILFDKEEAKEKIKNAESKTKKNDSDELFQPLSEYQLARMNLSEKFLVLYLRKQFILIEYNYDVKHKDFRCYSENEFALYLIKAINGNAVKDKKLRGYDTRKSQSISDKILREKNKEMLFFKKHFEINYLYGDNAGREYAITTDAMFTDLVDTNISISDELKSFKNYINELPIERQVKEYLTESAEHLAYKNRQILGHINEKFVVQSTEELIKLMNKKLKT